MRWITRILLGPVGIVLVAFGIIAAIPLGLILIETYRENSFYSAHPLLQKMRGLSDEARTILLLDQVPRGTTRSEVLSIMSTEKLTCARGVGSDRERLLICSARGRPCSVSRWQIDLYFDESDAV